MSVASPLAAQAATADLRDLPIVEVPAIRSTTGTIAIFLSGDGGWASIDKQVAGVLSQRGIGVVGLNSRAYLSDRKTPEQAASDVARIARAYLTRWSAHRLVLVGYSRGADMLPFIMTRFPDELRKQTALVAMLGLARSANFQFHVSDLFRDTDRPDDLAIGPELARLRGVTMLCVYGAEEKSSACRDADPSLLTIIQRPGDHHFDGNFRAIGGVIGDALHAPAP